MANIVIDDVPYRQQSGLTSGKTMIQENNPMDSINVPMLVTVVSVNYELGTIDYTIGSDTDSSQGTAILPVYDYGFNQDGNMFGRVPTVSKGTKVLIEFDRGSVSNAYVVQIYPTSSDSVAYLTPHDNTSTDRSTKQVLPSQQVQITDEFGNYTRTFNGSSFVRVWDDELSTQESEDDLFDGDGKPIINAFFKQTGNMADYPLRQQAQNWALVHESFNDLDTHRTMFYIDKYGGVQFSAFDRDTDTKGRLDVTADYNDGLTVKKVNDYDHTENTDSSTNYAELSLDSQNNINLTVHQKDVEMGVKITPDGTYIDGVLVASQNNFKELSDQLTTVRTNLDDINGQITTLGADFFTKLRSDLTTAQNSINSINKTLSTTNDNVADNAHAISLIDSEVVDIHTWEGQVNDTLTTIMGDNGSLDKLQTQITGILNRLPADKIITLQDVIDHLNANNYITDTQLKTAVKTVSDKLPNMALYVPLTDYDTLKQTVSSQQTDITNLTNQVSAQATTIDSLNKLQDTVTAQQTAIDTLTKQVADLTKTDTSTTGS